MLATCTVRRVRRASATRRSGAACSTFLILTLEFIIDPRKELGPFPLSEKSFFAPQTEIALFQTKISTDDSSNYRKVKRIFSPSNIFSNGTEKSHLPRICRIQAPLDQPAPSPKHLQNTEYKRIHINIAKGQTHPRI